MFAVSHAASESAMRSQCYEVMPVAWVESPIVDIAQAPMQGDEGAPLAWLVFRPDMAVAIRDLRPGDHVVLLSWLDRRSSRRTQHASTRGSAAASTGRLQHSLTRPSQSHRSAPRANRRH